jgi:hypothetical protein
MTIIIILISLFFLFELVVAVGALRVWLSGGNCQEYFKELWKG